MKAHITAEPRCALLWHFGPQAPGYPALERTARAFGVALRQVGPADLAASVGDLCRGRPSRAAVLPLQAPACAALVVSGLRHDDGSLNAFLDAVKNGGADIPLRAMVTPTSRDWTLAQLLQELAREHEALGGPA